MWFPGGNFRLSQNGTLEFFGNGPASFDVYGGIREVNDALKADLFNLDESVLYLLGIVCSENCRNKFNLPNLLQSVEGQYGEFVLQANGEHFVPGTRRSRPILWLRLRATKVGKADSWRLFFQKMEKLQSHFGFAQLGKCLL